MNEEITVTCNLSGNYTANDCVFIQVHRASLRIYEIWFSN